MSPETVLKRLEDQREWQLLRWGRSFVTPPMINMLRLASAVSHPDEKRSLLEVSAPGRSIAMVRWAYRRLELND